MSAAIETRSLTRRFGDFVALDGLDLTVARGEIFGLLGPNAAGKSTAIRLLAGILRADSGAAQILGLDLFTQTEQIKRRIGYVAQHFALYPDLTALENINFYGGLYGIDDARLAHDLLELYDLAQFSKRKAGLLSGGYQRRLAIAAATMHDPELIFLDEPTAGIDPVTRKELWDHFYALAASGKTLFVTTHYMEEAERCHQLAFLNRGELVARGSPLDIRNSLSGVQVYLARIPHNPDLNRELMHTDGVQLVNQFGGDLRIIARAPVTRDQLQRLTERYSPRSAAVTPVETSIEDAFMSITDDSAKRR
jgi:ABC-type multidrug transport system ATPase subunit